MQMANKHILNDIWTYENSRYRSRGMIILDLEVSSFHRRAVVKQLEVKNMTWIWGGHCVVDHLGKDHLLRLKQFLEKTGILFNSRLNAAVHFFQYTLRKKELRQKLNQRDKKITCDQDWSRETVAEHHHHLRCHHHPL